MPVADSAALHGSNNGSCRKRVAVAVFAGIRVVRFQLPFLPEFAILIADAAAGRDSGNAPHGNRMSVADSAAVTNLRDVLIVLIGGGLLIGALDARWR